MPRGLKKNGSLDKIVKNCKVRFNAAYFAITVILSGVIGFFSAWIGESIDISVFGMTVFTPVLAFILGYAGGDFIENLVKIILGKTTLLKK